jgi:hypothetical protein
VTIGSSQWRLGIPNDDWEFPVTIGSSQSRLGVPSHDWEFPVTIGNSQWRLGIPDGCREFSMTAFKYFFIGCYKTGGLRHLFSEGQNEADHRIRNR